MRLRLEQLMQDRIEVRAPLLEEEVISTVAIEVAFTNITPMVAVHKVIIAE